MPWRSFQEILEHRAAASPEAVVYEFAFFKAQEQRHLTHEVLWTRVRHAARAVLDAARPGDRALILLPPGPEFVVGLYSCLTSGVMAVPAFPPLSAADARRVESVTRILIDCGASAILCTSRQRQELEPVLSRLSNNGRSFAWLTDFQTQTSEPLTWQPPSPDDAAIIQYSSGSTGSPNGVVLTHGNFLVNLQAIHHHFACAPDSRGVVWLPPYHDMGLVGGILQPLYSGIPVTLMPPLAFLQRPLRWLETISATRATISGGPNFAYDLCTARISPEERERLDLRSWTLAFNGSEPVRASTLEAFDSAFAPCGFRRSAFYPCYGLAEAALFVSGEDRSRSRTGADRVWENRHIACGSPAPGHEIRIVDSDSLTECAAGETGEIWFRGPSVAREYWMKPEESRLAFQAFLGGEGPFLRTGDAGYLLAGQLYIEGRLKECIILSGRNHYPADIETALIGLDSDLQRDGCVALAASNNGREYLAIVCEVHRHAKPERREELVDAIRRAVASQCDLFAAVVELVKPNSLARTLNGKVKRLECRRALESGTLAVWGTTAADQTKEIAWQT